MNTRAIQICFLIILAGLLSAAFLRSPGTNDVRVWKNWFDNVEHSGPISGFKDNKGDYPPVSSLILFGVAEISKLLRLDSFLAIKLSLLFFLVLTSFAFWLWTRDIFVTLMLHMSLVLGSVALGYLDVYFAPWLILSLWSLKEGRTTLAAVLFSIGYLTKWQPIIIAPFIVIYIWMSGRPAVKRVAAFLLVCLTINLLALSVLGTSFFRALGVALGHRFLSGNALNFNWILTYLLRVLSPDTFGGLENGEARFIWTKALLPILMPKVFFLSIYSATVAMFFGREKTFENLILFSLMGYTAYFIFNTGVHENHLFLSVMLSMVLFWTNRKHVYLMVAIALMSNINLLLFYGIDGRGLGFSRVVGLDLSLPLACFNVVFFVWMWWTNIFCNKEGMAVVVGSLRQ